MKKRNEKTDPHDFDTMSTNETTTTGYDDNGAMVYIISVLLWYSTGIIFMLAMQMKARSELVEEATRRRTKFLIRNMRDQTHTKEILGELFLVENSRKDSDSALEFF